ncbi:hypothetical protein [Bacillus altitudinis]|uniref:hypothetical protein n=1 Tax=Bacillus altitudinis TaxID=293387 RepID=UPI0029434FB5|nr:hypothetical protein [Bacillus altitudinis]WOI42482.1 hypothetical protein RZ534_06095 [Bacillus altitudinis]
MNVKSEINQLQKQLLARLNVRKGSTLFTIIQEVSRQAFATSAFSVKQKNSTLAKKCDVTASTISRNLKKLKEKCADFITIEQDRNSEEKFASLIFTFIPQEMSNDLSNGQQTEQVKNFNEPVEEAENHSSLTTNPLVLSKNQNNINTDTVNKVDQENIIFDTYMEFKQQGIDKTLFNKVLTEVRDKREIRNFGAYLRGALNKVIAHMNLRKKVNNLMSFYDELIESTNYDLDRLSFHYNWLE